MLRYVIRRILYAFPILIGVSLLTFFLFYLSATPQQMARRNLSAKNPTPQQIQGWITEHGYDKSKTEQFTKHMSELFLFKFGKSDATGEDIWKRIRQGAGPSFVVGLSVFIGSLIASIALAIAVAYFRGTYIDHAATFVSVLMMSVAYLVWLIAGQFIFGKMLRWAPLAGWGNFPDVFRFLLIPTMVGVLAGLGGSVRLYRTFLLDEISQDYVRTARAKGVAEQVILFRHVLKNSAIPIITSVGTTLPALFLGGLLIESFFGIPGLGSFLVEGINGADFAVVRAMVFLGTVVFIIGLILTDIGYAIADPRVRLE